MPELRETLKDYILSPFPNGSSASEDQSRLGCEYDLREAHTEISARVLRKEISDRLRDKKFHGFEEQELRHSLTLLDFMLELGHFPIMVDPSFLSMASETDRAHYDATKVPVPKFAVYRLFDGPFKLRNRAKMNAWFVVETYMGLFNNCRKFPFPNHIPFHFMQAYRRFDAQNSKVERESRVIHVLSLALPEQTRNKIDSAKRVFGSEQIYAIPEVSPNQWNASPSPSNSLIVGVRNQRTYLIDCLDASPFEHYVTTEITRKLEES